MPVSVISWNTAGWDPTYKLIVAHFGDLSQYLDNLQCDVFCIQETKVSKEQLTQRKLGVDLPGWQSFWAFNKSTKQRGLNGVATFVREGCTVRSATQSVLEDRDMDEEGRCILTDHGAWSVINVYAPFVRAEGGPEAVKHKLLFLQALQRRMEKLHAAGQHVLLVGDLNLTYRCQDCKLARQVLRVNANGEVDGGSETMHSLHDLAGTWCSIGELSRKLRLPIEHFAGLKAGPPHLALQEEAVNWFQTFLAEQWIDIFPHVHPAAQERFTSWNQQCNLRYTNNGARLDYIICDKAAWDMGLVVSSLSSELPGGDSARSIEGISAQAAENAATNYGNWHGAATSGIAKGDGLSAQTDNMKLNKSQFPAKPFTGMVYTPPSYSDHIAVSVLLEGTLCDAASVNSEGLVSPQIVATTQDTVNCQPWRKQSSLKSFFGPNAKKQRL